MTEDIFIEDPSLSNKAYQGWPAVGIPVGGARGDVSLFCFPLVFRNVRSGFEFWLELLSLAISQDT